MSSSINDLIRNFVQGGGGALSDTVEAVGNAIGTNATVAGDAIATLAAGSLPAGRYRVNVYYYVSAIANGATFDNAELRLGGVKVSTLLHNHIQDNASNDVYKIPVTYYFYTDGTKALSVVFSGAFAATEQQNWRVRISATRIGTA